MLDLLAESITPTPSPVQSLPTKTATPEDFLLNLLSSFQHIDVVAIVKFILIAVIIIWLFFALWVLIDAMKRYQQWYIPVLWLIFVLPLNIVGLVAYVAIRPVLTNQEKEWSELELRYLQYELMSTATCPECHHLINPEHRFCPHCGVNLRWVCEKCKHDNVISNAYCVHCGYEHEGHKHEASIKPPMPVKEQPKEGKETLVSRDKNKIRIKKVNVWSKTVSFWKDYVASWRWLAHEARNKVRPRDTKAVK